MYSSSATRPYTISAINTFKAYERLGYIAWKGDTLVLDDSKALSVVTAFSQQFDRILTAEDNLNGDEIEEIRRDMEEETPFIQWLVKTLHVSGNH